jgi:acyl dehydratase
MADLGRLLTAWLGDGALRRFRFRFTARVHPGDVLTSRARITRVAGPAGAREVEGEAWVEDQEGRTVIQGSATALLHS